MSKYRSFLIVLSLLLCPSIIGQARESNNVIIVDENVIIKRASERLFGFNNEWSSYSQILTNNVTDRIPTDDDTLNFRQTMIDNGIKLPFNRMAGFSSQIADWKKSLGSMEERIPQYITTPEWQPTGPRKQNVGIVEWIKSTLAVDPNAEFSWVFNCIESSPQDNADLVEFLTGDPINNPNGGINWAQKRVDNGIVEPVRIACFEIGNELDMVYPQLFDIVSYINYAKATIQAVKEVDSSAKIALMGATNPWDNPNWRNWHLQLFSDVYLRQNCDFLALHTYYMEGRGENEIGNYSVMKDYMDTIMYDANQLGKADLKLYLSEQAVYTTSPTASYQIDGVLKTADFFNKMLNNPSIEMANYHSLNSGNWAAILKNNNNIREITAIGHLNQLFLDNLQNKVLKSEIKYGKATEEFANDGSSVVVMADETVDHLSIILVNKSKEETKNFEFQFLNNQYKLVNEVNNQEFTSYCIPTASVAVLNLVKIGVQDKLFVNSTPNDKETNVSVSSEIILNFSKAYIPQNSIRLTENETVLTNFTVENVTATQMKIHLQNGLQYDSQYRLEISGVTNEPITFHTEPISMFFDDFNGNSLSENWSKITSSQFLVSNGLLTTPRSTSTKTITYNKQNFSDLAIIAKIKPTEFGSSNWLKFSLTDGVNTDDFILKPSGFIHNLNQSQQLFRLFGIKTAIQPYLNSDGTLLTNNSYDVKLEIKGNTAKFYIKQATQAEYSYICMSDKLATTNRQVSLSVYNMGISIDRFEIFSYIPMYEITTNKITDNFYTIGIKNNKINDFRTMLFLGEYSDQKLTNLEFASDIIGKGTTKEFTLDLQSQNNENKNIYKLLMWDGNLKPLTTN